MIRRLLVAAVFFFGPMLLMFVLRNLTRLFRLWLAERRRLRAQPEIIDISPRMSARPSLGFIAAAILVGVLSTYWAWHYTQQKAENLDLQYVPAHMDAQGHLVPGRMVPVTPKANDGQSSN